MVFVNEPIDKDKKYSNWHTIDKKRLIVLQKISSHPDFLTELELTYKEKKMKIEVEDRSKIHGKAKVGERHILDMHWKIFRMWIPEKFQNEIDQIEQAIIDALNVRGANPMDPRINSVTVEFSPNYNVNKKG